MREKFNKWKYIIQQTQEIIKNKEKIFYLNTIILAIMFLVINFFVGTILNVYKFDEYAGRNIQIKVNFKDSVTIDNIKKIEKNLLTDKNINYIKYIPKEIAFENLEESLEMRLGNENPLSNSMLIYLRGIKTLEEFGRVEYKISKINEFDDIIIKREHIKKVLSFKRNLLRITRAISIFLIVPLILLFYFIFGLNFSYLEEEIKNQYDYEKLRHKVLVIFPYFTTKILTLLVGWILALIMFIPFYHEIVWQLYEINPFITLASIKEMYFYLINSLLITLVLLILAGIFFRNPVKEKNQ